MNPLRCFLPVLLSLAQSLAIQAQVEHYFIDSLREWQIERIQFPDAYDAGPIKHSVSSHTFSSVTFNQDSTIRTGKIGGRTMIEQVESATVWFTHGPDTHLLYDYNQIVGDTIYYEIVDYSPCGPQPGIAHDTNWIVLVLEEIDSILVNDFNRLYYRLSEWSFRGNNLVYCQDRVWLDGIGAVANPFHSEVQSVDKFYYGIDCVKYNDEVLLFSQFIDSECIPLGTLSPIPPKVTLFPNPSNGLVNIHGASESEVEIFDVLGNLVLAKKIESQQIDLSALSTGLYLIKVDGQILKLSRD